ncbi:MAG: hypothetical protein IJ124_08450, partial [Clostridia bacterium]|nr:hypothetical protein [Clostridia bacterium]
MNRNEYRRAFIMLRAAMQGYGGHVRLERRTMTGSMYFIVTAPEGAGTLRAALAGQRDGRYYAVPLGELSRDRRGQLTLAWQFDPRSIDGRPLEAYAWVAVADAGRGCALALTGNVEGARELDPAALARAVCERFAADAAPADDLPAPDAQQSRDDMQGDVKIYTGSRARVCAAAGMDSAEPGAPDGTVASDTIILETIPEGGASKEQTVVCIPANAELHSPTVPAAPGGSSAGKADFTASDEAKAEAVSPDVPAPGIDVAKEQTPVCNSESTAAAPAAESVSVESGEIPSTASPDASPSQPPVDASRTPEQPSELRLSAGQ